MFRPCCNAMAFQMAIIIGEILFVLNSTSDVVGDQRQRSCRLVLAILLPGKSSGKDLDGYDRQKTKLNFVMYKIQLSNAA